MQENGSGIEHLLPEIKERNCFSCRKLVLEVEDFLPKPSIQDNNLDWCDLGCVENKTTHVERANACPTYMVVGLCLLQKDFAEQC